MRSIIIVLAASLLLLEGATTTVNATFLGKDTEQENVIKVRNQYFVTGFKKNKPFCVRVSEPVDCEDGICYWD